MNRRQFIFATPAMMFAACSASNPSPNAPSTLPVNVPTTKPPVAVNAAEIIPAPQAYSFAVKANSGFDSVLQAFDAANVSYDAPTKLAGRQITRIGQISGGWKIDINEKPFCASAATTSVPAGSIIGCYIEDGRKVSGSCLSERPF